MNNFDRINHKKMAEYLARLCWQSKADCVCLSGQAFRSFLGVRHVKTSRIEQFLSDIGYLFPYKMDLYHTGTGGGWEQKRATFSGFFLSRVPIPDWMNETISYSERVDRLNRTGLSTIQVKETPLFTGEAVDDFLACCQRGSAPLLGPRVAGTQSAICCWCKKVRNGPQDDDETCPIRSTLPPEGCDYGSEHDWVRDAS
jgi:hypothetical protein